MNKIIFGSALIAILGYLIMGVYCAQETVLGNPEVAKIKKEIERIKWIDVCHMTEGEEIEGRRSYSYDCGGRVDVEGKRMKTAIEEFQLRHSGVIILKVPVKIYNRVWNDPALEPLRVYGVDLFWPFREGHEPPAEEESPEAKR